MYSSQWWGKHDIHVSHLANNAYKQDALHLKYDTA